MVGKTFGRDLCIDIYVEDSDSNEMRKFGMDALKQSEFPCMAFHWLLLCPITRLSESVEYLPGCAQSEMKVSIMHVIEPCSLLQLTYAAATSHISLYEPWWPWLEL